MDENDSETDSELVRQFQNGGPQEREQAFSILYQRHAENLQWYMLRLTQNPEISEDLTQKTFLKALKSLDSFRGESRFRNWLFRIGTNTWRNHIKKKRPESNEMDDLLL